MYQDFLNAYNAFIEKEDYEEISTEERAAINQQMLSTINGIDSAEKLWEFCKACGEILEDGPIEISLQDNAPSPEDIKRFEDLGYPQDFINWHKIAGHYVQFEDTRLNTTKSVLEEIDAGYYEALQPNGYLILTVGYGGDAYVLDTNDTENPIKLVSHDSTYTSNDALEELYSEEHEFWYDDEKESYHNPNNLNVDEIIKDDEYILTASYVKEHLKENIEVVEGNSFLDFVVKQSIQTFKERLRE